MYHVGRLPSLSPLVIFLFLFLGSFGYIGPVLPTISPPPVGPNGGVHRISHAALVLLFHHQPVRFLVKVCAFCHYLAVGSLGCISLRLGADSSTLEISVRSSCASCAIVSLLSPSCLYYCRIARLPHDSRV